MKTKSLALAAMAVTASLLSIGSVQAANVMTGSSSPHGITEMQDSNVEQVRNKRWYKNNNYNNNGYHNNHYHRHHNNNDWSVGTGVLLGLGIAPLLYNGYGNGYGNSYGAYNGYGSGSGHVRDCLNRYRTYNPRTDMFRGYDGYLHRCRS